MCKTKVDIEARKLKVKVEGLSRYPLRSVKGLV